MYDSNQIDVLDLIISVLQEHEKTLDSLIGRLEAWVAETGAPDPAEDLRWRFHKSF